MKKKVGILMNERKKITIEEFKKWKSDYQIFLNEMEKEADSNPNLTSDHIFLTKVATRLKKFQSDLLETDLSLIPSEDWKGIQWMSGTLNGIQLSGDFSNTHANIDFNYFNVDYSSGYNFDGCNVNPVSIYNNPYYMYYRWENIKSNDDAKRIFGSNYVKEHPEIFPPDDIPQNIQEDFYNQRLSIDACIQYPELFLSLESYNARSSTAYNLNDEGSKNDVNQYLNMYGISTFRSLYFNDRKTFDFITKYRILPNEEIADLNPTIPSQKKEILKRISNQIFDEFLNRGLKITLSKEEIPDFFYDYYPEMKIEFNDKDLEEKYSSRTLSLKDVKENYELFKNVDYRYLLPNYKCLIKEFGGLESFLTSFPDEYYEWIDELDVIKDNNFSKMQEQYHSLNDIVKKIYYEIANAHPKLDIIDLYLKHGGDRESLSQNQVVNILGENLLKAIQWNRDNDGLLDKKIMNRNDSFLSFLIQINNKKLHFNWLENNFISKDELKEANVPAEKISEVLLLANNVLFNGDWDSIYKLYQSFPQVIPYIDKKIKKGKLGGIKYEELIKYNIENDNILSTTIINKGKKVLFSDYLADLLNLNYADFNSSSLDDWVIGKKDVLGKDISNNEIKYAVYLANTALSNETWSDIYKLYQKFPQLISCINQKKKHGILSSINFNELIKFNIENNDILNQTIIINNKREQIGQLLLLNFEEIKRKLIIKKDVQAIGIPDDEITKVMAAANQTILGGNVEDLSRILKSYPKTEDIFNQKDKIEFVGKDKLLNYIKDKAILYEVVKKFDVTDIRNIVSRISTSNSSEIQRIGEILIEPILASNNPYQALDQIEDLFLKNNLPYVAKAYQVFKVLYPEYKENYGSPMLNAKSNRGKDILIFSDLIKASFGSNNRSVLNYLESIEKGNGFFQQILVNPNQLNQLSNRDKEILETYLGHLNSLYNQTMKGRLNGIDAPHRLGPDTYENVLEMAKLFSEDGKFDYDLPDRLTKMFCHFAGIDTFEDAKKYIQAKITIADKRHREAAKRQFTIEKGDFVKGLGDIKYIEAILQNGSVCKEFLGYASDSDSTPLDTDLTRIVEQKPTFKDTYDTRITGYGNISAVLKCDDRFIITKSLPDTIVDKAKFDTGKLEAFYTGDVNNTHYGIRTGFASSEIDYFVVDHNEPKLNFEIVKNGFYIPVVNEEGNLIFTPEQYDFMRTKMQGLSYYGLGDSYEFAASKDLITDDVQEIMAKNIGNQQKTKEKRDVILKVVEKCLATSGITPIYELEKDLVPGTVEIIDTGSTGRGTNKPNDGDFDFIVRLDKALISDAKKLEEFKNLLRKELKTRAEVKEETAKGDFRYKKVSLDGLDEPVDIDMTFIQKTDKVEYSTDMCLKDRLETIRNLSEEKYQAVLANIILAKKVLKEGKCYKPHHAPENIREDGLGGVGVENWILQNGGSFYAASKSFLAATEQAQTEIKNNPNISSMSKEEQARAEFDCFKKYYQIWDFGKNHMSEEKKTYPHDEFVYDNMAVDGYIRMKETLRAYVKKVDLERQNQSSNVEERADQIIATMASGVIDTEGNFIKETQMTHRTLGYADSIILNLMYIISILLLGLIIICIFFK